MQQHSHIIKNMFGQLSFTPGGCTQQPHKIHKNTKEFQHNANAQAPLQYETLEPKPIHTIKCCVVVLV